MPSSTHRRPPQPLIKRCSAAGIVCLLTASAIAQTIPAAPAPTPAKQPTPPKISRKDRRQADNAYLAGAKLLAANNASAAQDSFARAVSLDPTRSEYALSLAIAKQHHIHDLIQSAEKARSLHHADQAAALFEQARLLDPENPILLEHLAAAPAAPSTPATPGEDITRLAREPGGPIHLTPRAERHTFHNRGDSLSLLREVFAAYGIRAAFDPAVASVPTRFDLESADFDTASRLAMMMTGTFSVPLTPTQVLLAKDTQQYRDQLQPQLEETIYLPALPQEQLNELSSVAKNIFDLKQVQVGNSAGVIIVRGNESALRLVNTTFADLLDGGADVMLNIHLYEVDRNHMREIGAKLPSSAGVFNVAALAQNIINQNQSLIQQGIAAGVIDTSKGYFQTIINELGFLVASGVSVPQATGLLGTFGGGILGYSGLYLGSSSTFNLLLNSSDVHILDDVQLRVGDNSDGTFRAGIRYPITTSTYSSGLNSSLTSALSGVKINGVSVSSLLSQSAITVPMIQYEDLGLTLKAHPKVEKAGQIAIHLDMKIEALGGSALNNIPILNSRSLTSDITLREGQVAMLASEISNSELHSIQGLPGLSEIPGFQGTDKTVDNSSTEILITLEPRLVRSRSPITATRRLLANFSRAE